MTVRLASFNVENLFDRAKALATPTWAEGRPALAAFERFNVLAAGATYSDAHKAEMVSALETLEILKRSAAGNLRLNTNPFDAWALLRENRGDFLRQPRTGSAEVVALGRGDWIGWVELISDRSRPRGLRAQVEDELRDAIRSGRLTPGALLPSTRALAADLGVTRGVIVDAYDQLLAASGSRSATPTRCATATRSAPSRAWPRIA